MPQLDRIIVFSQIFWLFFIFSSLYVILTHHFLPKFLESLKSRKQIVNENIAESLIITNSLTEKQILLKQILLKNLFLVESSMQSKFIPLSFTKDRIGSQLIDSKIGFTSLNFSLYCDNQLLNSIYLFPKSLNLKYKN